MFVAIMNIICLLIWVGWLIHGINCCVKKKEVNKVGFICATFICILYFVEQIFIR